MIQYQICEGSQMKKYYNCNIFCNTFEYLVLQV